MQIFDRSASGLRKWGVQKGEYKRREARMCGRRKRKKPRETAVEVFCEFSFQALKKKEVRMCVEIFSRYFYIFFYDNLYDSEFIARHNWEVVTLNQLFI